MAYWLFCQSCQQWSKSVTPLSEDKACPFCSDLLMKVKGSANTLARSGGVEESAASAPPITAEVLLENAETGEVEQTQGLNDPAEVDEVVDQTLEKESELKSEDKEEPESDAGSPEGQDAPAEDSQPAIAEETGAACEDQDDLAAEEEAGEAKTPEADSVKVSEVRVVTDQSEKKDRLAKKARR